MGTGKQVLLSAFDRLFDRAATKLDFEWTNEEKDEARRRFVDRYEDVLAVLEQTAIADFSEAVLTRMETAIDDLSSAELVGHLAAGPLAAEMQKTMRAIAVRAAEQRLLEHFVNQADDTYGGN